MISSVNTKQKARWIEIHRNLTCVHVQSVIYTCYRVQNVFGKGRVHRVCMFHCCLALKPSGCAQVIPGSLYFERNRTNSSKWYHSTFITTAHQIGFSQTLSLKTYFQLFRHDSLKRSRLAIIARIVTCSMKPSHNWSKRHIKRNSVCFFKH